MAVLTLDTALPRERKSSRRAPLAWFLGLLLILMIGSSTVLAHRNVDAAAVPLDAAAVVVGPGGELTQVSGVDALVPGSRVLSGMPESVDLAREQAAWLAAGTVPRVSGLGGDMVSIALLDLHVLSRPYGVPVAGLSNPWRYVWPRDSALVAAAFARTGHLGDAERILDFLQHVQPASGEFQARYLPDRSGVPDGRGVELDGFGWALWATAQVVTEVAEPERSAFVQRYLSLVDRSTEAALNSINNDSALPAPSADYWEVKEYRLTLATAAMVCTGLESSAALYRMLGDDHKAQESSA